MPCSSEGGSLGRSTTGRASLFCRNESKRGKAGCQAFSKGKNKKITFMSSYISCKIAIVQNMRYYFYNFVLRCCQSGIVCGGSRHRKRFLGKKRSAWPPHGKRPLPLPDRQTHAQKKHDHECSAGKTSLRRMKSIPVKARMKGEP